MATEGLALLLASFAQAESSAPAPNRIDCSSFRTPEGIVTVIDQIAHVFFDSGGARIDEQGAAILDRYAAHVGVPPNCQLIVAAHADRVGPSDANRELSRRRADAVVTYLRSRGLVVPIAIKVFGETRPMVETQDGVAEPQNRRVELYVSEPRAP